MVCALSALFLLVDFVKVPDVQLREGSVAPYDVRASTAFDFTDDEATSQRRAEAAEDVAPVFDFDALLASRLQARVSSAFEAARDARAEAEAAALAETRPLEAHPGSADSGRARDAGTAARTPAGAPAGVDAGLPGGVGALPGGAGSLDAAAPELSREVLDELGRSFSARMGITLDQAELSILVAEGFSGEIEQAVNGLIGQTMRHYIIGDRGQIAATRGPVSVIRIQDSANAELRLQSLDAVRTLEEARQLISLSVLNRIEDGHTGRVAAAVARSTVRSNFSFNQLLTEERRQEAVAGVSPVVLRIAAGTTIARQGDVVDALDVAMVDAIRADHGEGRFWPALAAVFAFCAMLFGTIYSFAGAYIRKFSTEWRDLVAMGALMVVVLALARLTIEISVPLSQALSVTGLAASGMWFLVPVSGAALLVRILINSETSLIFAVVAGVLCGLMMEQQVVFAVFFIVSSVVATGAIGKDRERSSILRAGLFTGLLNVALVLMIDLILAYMGDAGAVAPLQPVWDGVFAFVGGLLAVFLVLGLVPAFEQFGFVTDLQLLEMGNLDHPLLRNLMLRAPGTYHHSVIVGTLAEAAAEAVGCNALLCRVCSYFHDIGKAIKPQYFTENQRDMPNVHDRLPPKMSAQLIIDHVREGGAIARRHKLPQPIIDAIYSHHGTGLLKHFYDKALKDDPEASEADFRYPGPRPSTREMGIIMLADKTEAACRSIRQPTPEKVSKMIQKIINSVIQDGQFQECPLTVRDLYVIAETFKTVILGIHHHRVEYPDTAHISSDGRAAREKSAQQGVPREAVITLELPSEIPPYANPDAATDYESIENLPGLETTEEEPAAPGGPPAVDRSPTEP